MKKEYPEIDIRKTGQNLKGIMLSKGYTVKDVQQFLDLGTPQSIYHWFAGTSMPTLDHIYALSKFFRVSVDSLLIGSGKHFCASHPDTSYQRLCMYYQRLRNHYR